MSIIYNDITYYLSDQIPEYVPLTKDYARINGTLQYSNSYILEHFIRINQNNDNLDDDIPDLV